VRHRDRVALRNLMLEFGNYVVRTAQHIAESHGLELRARCGLLQGLTRHHGEALACTHYVGRVDALSVEITTK
jgi:hypothetical protein